MHETASTQGAEGKGWMGQHTGEGMEFRNHTCTCPPPPHAHAHTVHVMSGSLLISSTRLAWVLKICVSMKHACVSFGGCGIRWAGSFTSCCYACLLHTCTWWARCTGGLGDDDVLAAKQVSPLAERLDGEDRVTVMGERGELTSNRLSSSCSKRTEGSMSGPAKRMGDVQLSLAHDRNGGRHGN